MLIHKIEVHKPIIRLFQQQYPSNRGVNWTHTPSFAKEVRNQAELDEYIKNNPLFVPGKFLTYKNPVPTNQLYNVHFLVRVENKFDDIQGWDAGRPKLAFLWGCNFKKDMSVSDPNAKSPHWVRFETIEGWRELTKGEFDEMIDDNVQNNIKQFAGRFGINLPTFGKNV